MSFLKILNLMLDLSLVAASIWMIFIVRDIGGIVGKTLTIITVGVVVLGLAHITETSLDYFFPVTLTGDLGEFIHRLMVFTGFVMLVLGFRQIRELR